MKTDDTAFLYHFVLDGDGGAAPLDPDSLMKAREDRQVWLHVDLTRPAARDWVNRQADLPDHVREILLAEQTRPRTYVDAGGVLIVLRGVNTNPGEDPEDMVAVRIWFDRNRLLSSRRRRLLSVIDVADSLKEHRGPKSAAEVLLMMIERLTDRIGEYVDVLEERLDDVEDRMRTGDPNLFRSDIAVMRRRIASVRRFISPQRDALDRLARFGDQLLKPDEILQVHQETDRITRYLEDLDLARERAIVMHEDLLSRIAQEQNSRMYVLSVVAAIFLPLTFVTGLLGMNVGGLPGLENPHGFLASAIVMLVVGIVLYIWFRMKRWL